MVQAFKKSFWGYRRPDVDRFITDIFSEHQAKVAAGQEEQVYLQRETQRLKEELAGLRAKVANYKEAEKAISDVLIQAQLQASSILEKAKKQAEDLEQVAAVEVAAKRVELNNLRRKVLLSRSEFEQLLEKYRSFLNESDGLAGEDDVEEFSMENVM